MSLAGLMQHHPLTTGSLIDHAARNHGATEIVSRAARGTIERTNWGDLAMRSRRVATMLRSLGAMAGDRIATLAWNRTAHLELYYGVTAGGMVLHTVNPRLFPDQISYIIGHGGAKIICIDPDLLPILGPVIAGIPGINTVLVLGAEGDIPPSSALPLLAYETLLDRSAPIPSWPHLDEHVAASLCYTSGTTGDPKGVLYSHRSTVLHAMAACAADSMALSARDSVLLVTPLFHVNAWGLPFAAAMCGAKLVLPGAMLDGASLHSLLRDESVTFSLGVPTVWFGLLDYLAGHLDEAARTSLDLRRVFAGGAAVPRALVERFRDLLGVEVIQAWGMTETSPVATVCRPLAKHADTDDDGLLELRTKQGRAVFGVELRIEDTAGRELPRDGVAAGILKVRGPWVLSAYMGDEAGSALDAGGWFDTGDIARLDADGFLQLTDRAKDMIKSGGEWISSIDLENAAAAHPAVAEAAVIGVPHPRWQERPVMLLRLHDGKRVTTDAMSAFLATRVARWWLPDVILIVDELPHTATGKLLKTQLRERYRDQLWESSTPPR